MNSFLEYSLDLRINDLLGLIQKRIMNETTYFGIKTYKNPLDFWVYKEIIFDRKPDVIIEIGNKFGGSTLALAHFLDIMKKGRIIGIDITHQNIAPLVKEHQRINLIEAPACLAFDEVKNITTDNEEVLIIEDSSHTYSNTFQILQKYSSLIRPGGYFIIEDSICHHGLNVGPSPGPYEAIEEFMKGNNDFIIDRKKESFLITWNPKGFLRRKEN